MANIDFDELDKEISDNTEETTSFNINKQKPKRGITEGWTKGPFIVGGVIALILILISLYIYFIM